MTNLLIMSATHKFPTQGHVETHHLDKDPRRYACPTCRRMKGTYEALRLHIRVSKCAKLNGSAAASLNAAAAKSCESAESKETLDQITKDLYKTRQDASLGRFWACLLCDKTAKGKLRILDHIEKCHLPAEAARYTCQLCGQHMETNIEYRSHCLKEHPLPVALEEEEDGLEEEQADENRLIFMETTQAFVVEKYDARVGKVYKCAACDKVQKQEQSIRKHAETSHVRRDKQRYRCPICNFRTSTYARFNSHFFSKGKGCIDRPTPRTKTVSRDAGSNIVILDATTRDYLVTKPDVRLGAIWSCSACHKSATNKLQIQNHIEAHHVAKDPTRYRYATYFVDCRF